MTNWIPPNDFAKVVASRAGFKKQLKAMTTAELVNAFESNLATARGEVRRLAREIAACMPGDFKLNGDKDTPGLLYLHMKASHEGRHWEEYLADARRGQGQAEPVKREPIAPRSWVEPREPGEDDDGSIPF